MENRGLCVTCVSNKDCAFPRKFPVVQCEEFTVYAQRATASKQLKRGKKI